MLTPNDREDLRWAMQASLLEESSYLHENNAVVKDFVLEEATYEQLLNLVFNPYSSNDVYMEAEDLEWVAKDVIYEMTGAYGDAYSMDTTHGKFAMLESILYEAKKGEPGMLKKGYESVKGKSQAALNYAGGKVAAAGGKIGRGISRAGEAVGGKGGDGRLAKARGAVGRGIGKVGKAAQDNPKTAAAITAAAAAASAYYVYRKLRKSGKSKSQSAKAAAAAERRAGNMDKAAKWDAKAKAYAAKGQ
jgi:hypothetical protein